MPEIDLNIEFDYIISTPYSPTSIEDGIRAAHPPSESSHWQRTQYDCFKTNLKLDHLRKQNDRCAYCRNFVEADGNYEPIEHIVAKSFKPEWMLEVTNLIVTCDPCNNLKNAEPTLTGAHVNDTSMPNRSDAFLIYNPHYDRWSEHFMIEDEIFLTARPQSKGADTIRICKLYRYNIPINYTKLLRMSHTDSYKSIAHKLYDIHNVDSNQYVELKRALDYFTLRLDPNILPALRNNNPILPDNNQFLIE